MSLPFPVPIIPGSGADGSERINRDKLREYVEQNGIVIRGREGRTLDIDQLLDEGCDRPSEISRTALIIGVGLLILLIAWIVVVLLFPL